MKDYLTIDVGGTNIKYAIIKEDGQQVTSNNLPTPNDSLEHFLTSIYSIIDQYKHHIAGIAFSVPGKVDTKTGTIYFGGALTYLDQLCLTKVINDKYDLPVSVQNDAKAAALAELWLGSLNGVTDAAVIVLGTGVGGGIILDGKLRMGPHFQSGELSLSVLEASKSDAEKMVGVIGSAVQMVSKINTVLGNENLKDGKMAFKALEEGHPEALKIFQNYCRHIAYLILNLQAFFDLTTYTIGGGISSQTLLIEEINRQFNNILDESPTLKMNIPNVKIIPTQFKNDANLYGALYQLLNSYSLRTT